MSTRNIDFTMVAQLSATDVTQFLSGKFTGQTSADLLVYKTDGTLWVGRNTGAVFEFTQWASVSPPNGWQFYAGDFTGTGRIDIVGYHSSNSLLWLGVNEGSKFTFVARGSVAPADEWQFAVGYFRGQSKAELVGYRASSNQLWIGTDNGTAFTFQAWESFTGGSGWTLFTGDFAGNGRTDVLMYNSGTGELHVGTNSGTGFTFTKWFTLDPASGWQIGPGYFTGRDKCDIFVHHPTTTKVYIAENTGNAFNIIPWGDVNPASGWDFVASTFDADSWTDIVAYYRGNHTVWRGRNVAKPVEGYCWPLSAAPGQTISFYVSGGQTITGQYMRHTSTGPEVTSTLMQTITFEATEQTTADKPWASGCGWTETISLTVPTDWPSGIYSLRCTDIYGRRFDITFMVKPVAAKRTKIAVLANVNTWLTYNGWGGQSKYSGLARTSFMRPCIVGQPEDSPHLTRGELWITGWLESIGVHPDVFTDIDFHNDGLDASQYKVLILSTHPEYWSTQMYDNLEAYLKAGGTVLYLGANGISEFGTYSADKKEMTFRAGVEGGSRANALFRVLQNPARPERSLLGVCTERCGVPGSPYIVKDATHPFFAGIKVYDPTTGVYRNLQNGDRFGGAGLNTGNGNGKASGWEVDTSSGPGATGVPLQCEFEIRNIPPNELPSGMKNLASGEADSAGPGADMVHYVHSGGGFVFSVGSITFGGSLVIDPVIQQLMRNVLGSAGIT